VENILQTAYNCPHRQIVFTIPKELRCYFFAPFKERISILFQAVNETIYSILNITFKKKKGSKKATKYISKVKYTPGFFSFLHSFGRDLKWNPHIHVLLAEIKLGEDNSCKKWDYFDFDALSKRFQKILLVLLEKDIGKFTFKPIKNKVYKTANNGLYVKAKKVNFQMHKKLHYIFLCRATA